MSFTSILIQMQLAMSLAMSGWDNAQIVIALRLSCRLGSWLPSRFR